MSRTLVFSISQKSLSLPKFPKFHLKFFWIFSFVLMTMLAGIYLFQINAVFSDGYQIKKSQSELNSLLQENKNLEINSNRIDSLMELERRVKELGFEKAGEVRYIQILDDTVARAK